MKSLDRAGAEILLGELAGDMASLEELLQENSRAWDRIEGGARDTLDWAALGYTIHNIYCLMENYFLRVAKAFENNVERDQWHRDLVNRMAVDIEGFRPALLAREDIAVIDELRGFRHVFRNIYRSRLQPEKVELVQRGLASAVSALRVADARFRSALRASLEDEFR